MVVLEGEKVNGDHCETGYRQTIHYRGTVFLVSNLNRMNQSQLIHAKEKTTAGMKSATTTMVFTYMQMDR
jgi:hypothetical protein